MTPKGQLSALLLLTVVGALAACGEQTSPAPQTMIGTLDLEIRDSATVTIAPDGKVSLEVTAGFGLLEEGAKLVVAGRTERLAESSATLYTARFDVPPQSGPCKAAPISLALSLHRQGGNATVYGGLTAYCGADTWYGVPVRVLRLAGQLPVR